MARVAAFDAYEQMFSRAYIDSNAGRFLENDWIDPTHLSIIPSTRVKIESAPASVPSASTALIKQEPQSAVLDTLCSNPIKICTLTEGGQEILEILSDTDHSDTDSDLEVTTVLTRGASRSSSAAPVKCETSACSPNNTHIRVRLSSQASLRESRQERVSRRPQRRREQGSSSPRSSTRPVVSRTLARCAMAAAKQSTWRAEPLPLPLLNVSSTPPGSKYVAARLLS
ncbi:hypothetical protein B0H14DRAFT_3907151 [Mycena olivaceomarginata]|nr:hypothetical protein B0H14DRAFT_3907151 [Mycena olivaceomarginata]